MRVAHREWRTLITTTARSIGVAQVSLFLIPTDGAIERGRPEAQVGAHCKNHNSHSFGVAYVRGLAVDGKPPCDTRTETQKSALELLLSKLNKRYPNVFDSKTL